MAGIIEGPFRYIVLATPLIFPYMPLVEYRLAVPRRKRQVPFPVHETERIDVFVGPAPGGNFYWREQMVSFARPGEPGARQVAVQEWEYSWFPPTHAPQVMSGLAAQQVSWDTRTISSTSVYGGPGKLWRYSGSSGFVGNTSLLEMDGTLVTRNVVGFIPGSPTRAYVATDGAQPATRSIRMDGQQFSQTEAFSQEFQFIPPGEVVISWLQVKNSFGDLISSELEFDNSEAFNNAAELAAANYFIQDFPDEVYIDTLYQTTRRDTTLPPTYPFKHHIANPWQTDFEAAGWYTCDVSVTAGTTVNLASVRKVENTFGLDPRITPRLITPTSSGTFPNTLSVSGVTAAQASFLTLPGPHYAVATPSGGSLGRITLNPGVSMKAVQMDCRSDAKLEVKIVFDTGSGLSAPVPVFLITPNNLLDPGYIPDPISPGTVSLRTQYPAFPEELQGAPVELTVGASVAVPRSPLIRRRRSSP